MYANKTRSKTASSARRISVDTRPANRYSAAMTIEHANQQIIAAAMGTHAPEQIGQDRAYQLAGALDRAGVAAVVNDGGEGWGPFRYLLHPAVVA